MKRLILLSALVVIGGLSLVAAQQAQAPKVIEVDKIKDNLFVLKGGGGNTAVFVTASGVVVVDAKNPGWGQPILDTIKTLTDKPVTTLINTHTHGDHVSGNVEFPATIDVIAQENTKANMENMPIFKENAGKGMAKRTFKNTMTIGNGADQVDLYYFGPGHTSGDAWVVFPALRVAHAADMFWQRALPLVDAPNGGSVLHFADTLQKAHDGMKNIDIIINGHNPTTTTPADLQTFADFNKDFLTWAQGALKAGKTPQQAAAEWKIPEKYQGYSSTVNPLFGGIAGMLERLQAEMKK
jgi:glyoxylase-like metal-dependent hydrolase (beta-lactamase superfamily II)